MPKSIVRCDTCGNLIEKYPSLIKPHNFCSDACYRVYRRTLVGNRSAAWKGGEITLICPQCGKAFSVSRAESKRRRYCSRKCKSAATRRYHICQNCGKLFHRTGTRHKFCSYACYKAYRHDHPRACSPETRVKIAIAQTGKPGLNGPNNPMYKTGYSVMATKMCPHCGKSFRGPAYHTYCSRECVYATQGKRLRRFYEETPEGLALVARYKEEMRSCGHPEWAQDYAPGFTKSLKRRILRRDGQKCRLCGSARITKGWLVVHHIDGFKSNHDPSNLITLCKSCHLRIHRNHVDLSENPQD